MPALASLAESLTRSLTQVIQQLRDRGRLLASWDCSHADGRPQGLSLGSKERDLLDTPLLSLAWSLPSSIATRRPSGFAANAVTKKHPEFGLAGS